eukprot:797242-Rhodomonas_salina.2
MNIAEGNNSLGAGKERSQKGAPHLMLPSRSTAVHGNWGSARTTAADTSVIRVEKLPKDVPQKVAP